jgi:N-acetylglucosamine kinase-like BadF-type ATPase
MVAAEYYLGIDAGGTGTRAVLVTADGQLVAIGKGSPTKQLIGAAGRRGIEQAVDATLAPLVRIGRRACVVQAGVTGITVPGKREAFSAAVRARLPHARIHVTHDAAIAAAGALAGAEGVAVVAGSGSIALARSADGREGRAGGYGYLLGDEGSAFWLGRGALASVMRALDGRGPATRLIERLCQQAGVTDPSALPGWVYAGRRPIERFSELAPLVARAAQDGDGVALHLLQQAGCKLAELSAAAARQLWPTTPPTGLPVATCGGVWSAGALLHEPFVAALARLLPETHTTLPRLAPLGGAVLLAMQADQRPVNEALVARLEATMSLSF